MISYLKRSFFVLVVILVHFTACKEKPVDENQPADLPRFGNGPDGQVMLFDRSQPLALPINRGPNWCPNGASSCNPGTSSRWTWVKSIESGLSFPPLSVLFFQGFERELGLSPDHTIGTDRNILYLTEDLHE